MAKGPRIDNDALLAAGLELMRQNGKPLSKAESFGRAMKYSFTDGRTVRVRTCNDHILVVLADRPMGDAKLNIEGTDYLLIVMPEIQRTHGNVIAYLVPTQVAVDAARKSHNSWLSTNPNTRGDNRTWNLWFDFDGPSKANNFASIWEAYRLKGNVSTQRRESSENGNAPSANGSLRAEVEAARQRIAAAAGVAATAVRITVDFGA